MPNDDLPEWVRQQRRDVGLRLYRLRTSAGLTQEELAARIGVDHKTVSRAENGHHNIGIDLVARLARGLDIDSWRLFRD